jgi:prevent-host-death family protein
METFNIHAAKTHLSRLVLRASRGETIVIAKSGRPLARLVPLEPSEGDASVRLGFLIGSIVTPDDFDHLGESEIAAAFQGE